MTTAHNRRRTGLLIVVSLVPGLVFFTAFYALPTVTLAVTSFTNWSVSSISFVGVQNYAKFLADPVFWQSARNSLFYVLAAVIVQVPLATFIALTLARRIAGWRVIRTLLFIPNMMSGAVIGLIFVFFFNARFGLLNGILSAVGLGRLSKDWLFNPHTAIWAVSATWVFSIGLYVILIMTEVQSLPVEVLEAAQLDGANRRQVNLHVILPLVRPIVSTCMLLALLFTLGYFDGVYVMTQGGPNNATATLALYGYNQYAAGNWGEANAVGIFIFITGVLLVLLVRRIGRTEVAVR